MPSSGRGHDDDEFNVTYKPHGLPLRFSRRHVSRFVEISILFRYMHLVEKAWAATRNFPLRAIFAEAIDFPRLMSFHASAFMRWQKCRTLIT